MERFDHIRMDAKHETHHERDPASQHSAYAINAQYAALAKDNQVYVEDLVSNVHTSFSIGHDRKQPHSKPLLAFSPARLNLLAVASGSHIIVYNVETHLSESVVKGNGQTISALEFSPSDHAVLASGCVDGSICIWSLKSSSRPIHQLRTSLGPCLRIALSPHDLRTLAACHQNCISVWALPAGRPKVTMRLDDAAVEALSWCPKDNGRVLSVTNAGRLTISSMRNALGGKSTKPGSEDNLEDSDEDTGTMFGELEGIQQPQSTSFAMGYAVKQSTLLGHHGIVVLPCSVRVIYFYSYSLDSAEPTELWRLNVGAGVNCFAIRTCKATVKVIACFDDGHQTFDVPTPVLDGMGWTWARSLEWLPVLEALPAKTPSHVQAQMLPLGVHKRERPRRRREGDGRKLRPKSAVHAHRKKPKSSFHKDRDAHEQSSPKSMVTSLELPRIAQIEDESPMPFLSPSIPARKVSPGPITPLDELVQLPGPRASFDTMSSAATQGHESDSDDETFAPHMQGSGTLLPGGVNVPLPRSCGACFGPNGQLATFFPVKPKTTPIVDDMRHRNQDAEKSRGLEVSKLFPSFGNLGHTNSHDEDAEFGSESSVNGEPNSDIPQFAIQASSFDSRPSWSAAKISPIKAQSNALVGQHGIRIAIQDLETMLPTRRTLASSYQLSRQHVDRDSETCHDNATCAQEAGLGETAHAWRLLAFILEHRSSNNHELDHVSIMSSARPKASRNFSMASSFSVMSSPLASTDVLAFGPFGGTWAAEELFAWAEKRADLQLLASMSTFLIKSPPPSTAGNIGKVATPNGSYFEEGPTMPESGRSLPGVPVLRTNSSGLIKPLSDSLTKPRSSRASSRNPSQPTTPYLDSSTSTPPMTLPTLSRQGSTGLSPSGSMSPEHHRSSFSMAARNYAASIAEKFGSYGSSPPSKRTGASPGHELPSSLPTGSLSKSVSFASGIPGEGTGRRSLSLAQEDDNYDSDRTIEDGSLPHTPKGPSGGVAFKVKQHTLFDETSITTSSPALSTALSQKCKIWRQRYAEQLRSWGLALAAAELETITDYDRDSERTSKPDLEAVLPVSTITKHNTCSICFCLIRSAQQMCPNCLHTTHPACLEDFIDAFNDLPFACPAGCGCDCTSAEDLHFSIEESDSESIVSQQALPYTKRGDLTNPLRRQKLQGESL